MNARILKSTRGWASMVVALALVAAACGSGDGGSSADEAAEVHVALNEFSISPAQIAAPAEEPIAIQVANEGQAPHSFAIDAGGELVETELLEPGASTLLELPPLDVGTYEAWCTVPGHRELGMTALLVVGQKEASSAGDATGTTDHSGMTADEMAQSHLEGVQAFPAETEAHGNQPLEPTIQEGVKIFQITAGVVQWEISPGVFKEAFAYNGQVPGPQIRVQGGDRVRFVLQNELPQPTVLHFHGMTVPNAMDGVPYITQDPVMPGGYFVYEFKVKDPAGTYVYHSHFNSTEQVGKGLFGALIVEPEGKPAWDQEYTLFLGDGPLDYTLNGKSFPATAPLSAKRGDQVLIRLANYGSLLHPMHLHGHHFTVIAQDGMAFESPYLVDTLVVAPGQRFDVLVDARYPGVWAFHCHILSHVEGPQGMFGMVTALVVE
ncbi:MAG: multicopper oxidase domain-containing protein [Actinomycetota bacterium]